MKLPNLLLILISTVLCTALLPGDDPSFEKGEFYDKRNNKTYKTVIIGDQEWFAENLSFTGVFKDGADYICLEKDNDLCEKYGRQYSWEAMTPKKVKPKMRSICPKGWHLPTKLEWKLMCENVNNFRVLSVRLLDGGGDTELDLTLSGKMNTNTKKFQDIDRVGYYWTSTTQKGMPLAFQIWSNTDYKTEPVSTEHYGLCRCVRGK